MADDIVQTRTVARAAQILGGVDQLASRLQVSARLVRMWLNAKLPLPDSYFFLMVDIIGAADKVAEVPRMGERDNGDHPKR